MQTTYRPGTWYLVALPGALVALPPDVPAGVVEQLWQRMPERTSLATVVEVLAAHAGGDVTALPPFAAAVMTDPDVRLALRGDVTADVVTDAGSQQLSGAELTTWSERVVADAVRVELSFGGGDEAELFVHSAVVRASSVTAILRAQTPGAAPAADAPAAALVEDAPVEPEAPAEPEAPVVPAEPEAAAEPDVPAEPVVPAEPEEPAEPEAPAEPAEVPAEPDVPAAPEATIVPSEVTLAPSAEDFDQLWGATVHAPPAPAAPALPAAGPVMPTPDAAGADAVPGDHDGSTVSVAELRALRQQAPPASDAPTAVLPVVPGPTGRITVSTGQTVALDRTVIIGRRPRSTRASGANLPHLIAVDSPQQDISRSHLEIRPEGDTVVVIDLHTTNGSTLLRAGSDPVRLHPGEQTIVISGDVIDLGDGVEVVFEDLP